MLSRIILGLSVPTRTTSLCSTKASFCSICSVKLNSSPASTNRISPHLLERCTYINSTEKRCYSSRVKIYTKTGDKGTSLLFTGERRSKSDNIFEALGHIDELSSFIGLAKENALENKHEFVEQLERIQCILQDIGTLVASPVDVKNIKDKERREKIENRMTFNKRHIEELEGWIDQFTETLPPLTNFILPGGGKVSASLHVARTVCRRAERSVVSFSSDDEIDRNVLVYLNRLSDYLFTVARHATILDGKKETIYIRPKSKSDKLKEEARRVEEKG